MYSRYVIEGVARKAEDTACGLRDEREAFGQYFCSSLSRQSRGTLLDPEHLQIQIFTGEYTQTVVCLFVSFR